MCHRTTRGVGVRTEQIRLVIMLSLAVGLVGCVATTTQRAVPTPTATAVPASSQGDMDAGTAGRLVSQRTDSPPVIDGQTEAVWAAAEPLRIPLTWGIDGTEHALDVELWVLHTDQAISFLAQWSGEPPSGEENTVSNKLTLHWRIPEPAAQKLDCSVVCHTAFADGAGRFAYANSETIPQGGSGALAAAGGWEDGTWTLEWSRPLVSSNPFDIQFDETAAYTFLVKVFERVDNRPDPVSERYLLVLQP